MDAISVSKRSAASAASAGSGSRQALAGLRNGGTSKATLLKEMQMAAEDQFADSSPTGDAVCSNLDHFREATSFFQDLARLTDISASLCKAVHTPSATRASATELCQPTPVQRVEELVALVACCARVLDRYQTQPTLLDRHLLQMVEPLAHVVQNHLNLIPFVTPVGTTGNDTLKLRGSDSVASKSHRDSVDDRNASGGAANSVDVLAASLSLRLLLHLVYSLCKVRGYKAIQLLLPQSPELLEPVVDLCEILFEAEISSGVADSAPLQVQTASPSRASPGAESTERGSVASAGVEGEEPSSHEGAAATGCAETTSKTGLGERAANGEARGHILDDGRASFQELLSFAKQLPLWSTHYSLLVWLSLLVLAPFGLESLDSSLHAGREAGREEATGQEGLATKRPQTLGLRIVLLAEAYLRTTNTKASDAAAFALARFFSRPDISAKAPELFPHFLGFCQQSLFAGKTKSASTSSTWAVATAAPRGSEATSTEATSPPGAGASSPELDGSSPSSVPIFRRANAIRALNEILKIIGRRAVLPELPRLLSLLGLTSCEDERSLWTSLSSLSALFRKLRCSCAARLCMLLLPPVNTRSLRWRYTPHARCLTTLLQERKQPATPGAGEAAAVSQAQQAHDLRGEPDDEEEEEEDVPEQVEEVIGLLLERLSDRDSAVRWTAAKSVARVVMQLPRDFADQVVATVLDSLASVPLSSSLTSKRLWQGSCLALAELLRRGLVGLQRLGACCASLRLALAAEAGGSCAAGDTSAAAAVAALRDAACYAAWSLARSYYRTEALKKEVETLSRSLLLVALFDREVNCRRAAAAAFQELEGRHGGIPCGLRIVTLADFFALATRRSSYLRVAPEVASLHRDYARLLLQALSALLLSPYEDEEIRTLGAAALKRIAVRERRLAAEEILPTILAKSTAAEEDFGTRHGALLGLTALTEALCGKRRPQPCSAAGGASAPGSETGEGQDPDAGGEGLPEELQAEIRQVVLKVEKQRQYRGKGGDLCRVAVCKLIQGLASSPSITFKAATARRYLTTLLEGLRHFSETVQLAAAEALRTLLHLRMPAAEALEALLPKLAKNLANPDEHVAARRGYVLALATLAPEVYRRCLSQRKPLGAAAGPLAGAAPAESSLGEPRGAFGGDAAADAAAGDSFEGDLLEVLCREATSLAPCGQPALGDAQTRRNALIALGSALSAILTSRLPRADKAPERGGATATAGEPPGAPAEEAKEEPEGHSLPSSSWAKVVDTLEACSADFQADERGDVGSWVREVACETACFILENVSQRRTRHAARPRGPPEPSAGAEGLGDPKCEAAGGREPQADDGAGGLSREDTLRLVNLVVRMAMENLDRTRSRAAFLLYHMTAPLCLQREDMRVVTHIPPFRIEWIWGRVFHDYSYELGAAGIPPLEEPYPDAAEGESPPLRAAPCFLTLSLGSQSPPFLRLLQRSLLPVAVRQKLAFEDTKPELPFQRLNLSDLSSGVPVANLGSASPSPSGAAALPAASPASGAGLSAPQASSGRGLLGGGRDPQSPEFREDGDEGESFWETGGSFDFLLELSVIDGGCATLHKTRKAGVLLRLPLFTDPEVTYPRLLPLLLLPPYRRRAAEGSCLGLGAAMGSTADKTAEAFLSFMTDVKRLAQPLHGKSAEAGAGQDRATCGADELSSFYCGCVAALQATETSEDEAREKGLRAPNAVVTHALVEVLAECAAALRSGASSAYIEKLSLASLRAVTLVLSNESVTPEDVPRLLALLTAGPFARGAWLRSFQLVKSRCEAFMALATATTGAGDACEERREAAATEAQKVALCHALSFLLHRFPKIRSLAAEAIYGSLLCLSPGTDFLDDAAYAERAVSQSVPASGPACADGEPLASGRVSDDFLRLSEQQFDEAMELLTLTPWLELDVQGEGTSAACGSAVGGAESRLGASALEADAEAAACSVERLAVLLGVQKQWRALALKKKSKATE
ncbi:hypothetical protein BESB_063200 [Besnoitia besnoiti]|uniref:Tubulin-folding cofactor D ARM repeats domain-containing protein n=1 Tax=Besnoitia besnoiti TaxID=94643 RepID=A0A2A9MIH0_BESBE|nr:hypothetical protein BESB_063200 [Besnoitia besnoiti]PFH35433.1 hypothetical protein BESB_063200 [Besnoitia besnoiti]